MPWTKADELDAYDDAGNRFTLYLFVQTDENGVTIAKEYRTASWQGRDIRGRPIPDMLRYRATAARRATRTKGQPIENTRPRRHAPNGTALPAEMLWEDANRLLQPCPPASTK